MDDGLFKQFEHGDISYVVGGFEYGESGTYHIQGYLMFTGPKRLTTVKRIFPTAHLEIKRGTVKQAIDYCKKDGNYFTHGPEPSEQWTAASQKNKERCAQAIKSAKENKLDQLQEEDPEIYLRYERVLTKLATENLKNLPDLPFLNNYWYYGSTGTGKSKKVRQEHPDAYRKNCNKWWDGYKNHEVVVIEDIDKQHACLGHHLKLWTDHYPFLAEVKGSTSMIRPKSFFITSNYTIDEIFEDPGISSPLKRRFHVVHFNSL